MATLRKGAIIKPADKREREQIFILASKHVGAKSNELVDKPKKNGVPTE